VNSRRIGTATLESLVLTLNEFRQLLIAHQILEAFDRRASNKS